MIILITSTLGEPYLALLQQPGFLVPVLPEQFQGPLGRAQAAVRRGAVDTLTVVFKLDISRALETRLVLLYQSQGVLGPAWTRAKQEEEERQKIREWRRTLEDTKPEEEAKKEKGGMKTVESRRKREGGREGSNEHRYKERYKSFGGGGHTGIRSHIRFSIVAMSICLRLQLTFLWLTLQPALWMPSRHLSMMGITCFSVSENRT